MKKTGSLADSLFSGGCPLGAALCFLLAFPAAVVCVSELFTAAGTVQIRERIAALGILGDSEQNSWFWIAAATRILTLLASLLTGGTLLFSAVAYRRSRTIACHALSVLAWISRAVRWLLRAIACLLAGLFVFRVVRYLVLISGEDLWVYLLFSMLLGEGICGVGAFFLWRWFDRFFRGAADTCDALAYCALSETADSSAVSPIVPASLLVFSGIALLLIPLWGRPIAILLFLPVAAGNLLLSLSLRRAHALLARKEREKEKQS